MQVVFLVLYKTECLQDLVNELKANDFSSGTIIDSYGIYHAQAKSDQRLLDQIRIFIENPHEDSKILFFIVKNERVEQLKSIIDRCVGGIENPHTGIIFGFEPSFFCGLHHS